jgi:hypothetical protein
MHLSRSIAAISAALALSTATASAQMINFTTSGAFSGCSSTGGVALVNVWCEQAGGIRLTYSFAANQVLNGFGNAQFGSFSTSGNGPSTFAGVLFALTVNQTTPSVGSALTSTSVTGTVSAIQGGLVWGEVSPFNFAIGNVNYSISRDMLTNGVRIDPPGVGGIPSDPQTIRGFVTTVPEPSTYLLMASGLAALGLVAKRRRTV